IRALLSSRTALEPLPRAAISSMIALMLGDACRSARLREVEPGSVTAERLADPVVTAVAPGFTPVEDVAMSGIVRPHRPSLLALLILLPASRAGADVQEAVEHYRSGEAQVTIECFAPAARGKFPAVLLLHGSGGLDPGTAYVFREIGRD